jgi:hypothetical protein
MVTLYVAEKKNESLNTGLKTVMPNPYRKRYKNLIGKRPADRLMMVIDESDYIQLLFDTPVNERPKFIKQLIKQYGI